jgi:sarcosine oxidase gamma subunit
MADRGRFWSPIPDWENTTLDRPGLRIEARLDGAPMHLVSGNLAEFLARNGLASLGPRDRCGSRRYALRLAPDRVLMAGDIQAELGWSAATACAATDVTDGYLRFDVSGDEAEDVMAFGGHYDWRSEDIRPEESAAMLFAGLKTIVGRRDVGWRLHIERSLAPALWRWLEEIWNSGSRP